MTPSYNQARFLGETMRSVLEQNAAVDYVVQDGGSGQTYGNPRGMGFTAWARTRVIAGGGWI